MQSHLILSILLLFAIALATPHEKEDTDTNNIDLDSLGGIINATKFPLINSSKSASFPDIIRTANIQFITSVLAQEPSLSAPIEEIITPLPSTLRDQALISICEGIVVSGKKAEIEATASSSSLLHTTTPLKPKSSPSSHSKTSGRTAIPPAVTGGERLNHATLGGYNNSTTSAPIVISTTETVAPGSATQDANVAFSTLQPSSTPNVGMIQPTGFLKAAGALAVGVAGMMILL